MNRKRPDFIERNRIALLLVALALILVGVLWPGHAPPQNGLHWQATGPGLHFGSMAQAVSEKPILSLTGEMTIEVWLVPDFKPGLGNQEILSFVDEKSERPLLLGQFPRGFMLRGRKDNPKGDPRLDGYLSLSKIGLTDTKGPSHLAITVNSSGSVLHVNGRKSPLILKNTVARKDEPFGGKLMLGSSNTGWQFWKGGMLAVAIYDRVLPLDELLEHSVSAERIRKKSFASDQSLLALYLLEEGQGVKAHSGIANTPALEFPHRMTQPTRSTYMSVYPTHPGNQLWKPFDILSNIMGFMPLGFIVAWKQRPSLITVALAMGFALSLTIELIQPMIPGRDSSIVDLASNSTGALLGAVIAWIIAKRLKAFH
ncbi:MAG: hypothetical protein CL917_00220 [Deltaproteobacteria bacterium]|nr:hypothetical protein [Deltaproteobacteria bacterium]